MTGSGGTKGACRRGRGTMQRRPAWLMLALALAAAAVANAQAGFPRIRPVDDQAANQPADAAAAPAPAAPTPDPAAPAPVTPPITPAPAVEAPAGVPPAPAPAADPPAVAAPAGVPPAPAPAADPAAVAAAAPAAAIGAPRIRPVEDLPADQPAAAAPAGVPPAPVAPTAEAPAPTPDAAAVAVAAPAGVPPAPVAPAAEAPAPAAIPVPAGVPPAPAAPLAAAEAPTPTAITVPKADPAVAKMVANGGPGKFPTGTLPMGVVAPLGLHGSGSSIPAVLLWRVFEDLQMRARPAVRFTYRSVGSGIGQQEFLAGATDYGTGDVPMPADGYKEAATKSGQGPAGNRTSGMAHIPFMLGTVSVFHNIPGAGRIVLQPCTLAKVFKGEITTWSDGEILRANPSLRVPGDAQIKIVHREDPASSTFGMTAYLKKSCPEEWGEKPALNWPGDMAKAGTGVMNGGEMIDAMLADKYTIGYVSSGQGLEKGLKEVALRNNEGTILTSRESDPAAAGERFAQVMPALTADWSAVSLVNLNGKRTWPITLPTMIYAARYMQGRGLQGRLLKALITYVLSDEVQTMLPLFGFAPLPPAMLDLVRLQADKAVEAADDLPAWRFEEDTQPILGAANFVFSSKRGSWMLAETLELEATQDVLNMTRTAMSTVRRTAAKEVATAKGVAGAALALSLLSCGALAAVLLGPRLKRREGWNTWNKGWGGVRGGVKFPRRPRRASDPGGDGVSKEVDHEAQAAAGGIV